MAVLAYAEGLDVIQGQSFETIPGDYGEQEITRIEEEDESFFQWTEPGKKEVN